MHDPAHVPELGDDAAAGAVHGLDDPSPRGHLFGRPEPRRAGPAQPLLRNTGGFGDDQSSAGALCIVLGHDRGGHVGPRAAPAGERGHEDAVGRIDGTDRDGIEQGRHRRGTPQNLKDRANYTGLRPALASVRAVRFPRSGQQTAQLHGCRAIADSIRGFYRARQAAASAWGLRQGGPIRGERLAGAMQR